MILRIKSYWREVYVCRECRHITLGYFANARMVRHQQHENHSGVWNFRARFDKQDMRYLEKYGTVGGIASEKVLDEADRKRILDFIEQYRIANTSAWRRLLELEYGIKLYAPLEFP